MSQDTSPTCEPSLCSFFNDTATTEIYTLSLHDALPISPLGCNALIGAFFPGFLRSPERAGAFPPAPSSAARLSSSLRYASIRHCDTLLYVIASVAKQSSAFFAEWIAAVPSEPRNDGETPLCVIARAFPRHPGLRPGIWLASLNCFALLLRRPQRWKCVLATCTLARIPWHLLLYFNNKFVFEKGFGNEENISYPGGALRGPGNHLLRQGQRGDRSSGRGLLGQRGRHFQRRRAADKRIERRGGTPEQRSDTGIEFRRNVHRERQLRCVLGRHAGQIQQLRRGRERELEQRRVRGGRHRVPDA